MADVFRQGRKSVHRAIVSGDPDDPGTPSQCQFDRDPGGAWGPVKLPGPECSVCFAMGGGHESTPRRTAGRLAGLGGALALAFLGGVWASPDQRPMISYTASTVPSTTPSWAAPSATAGIPSQTPAPTFFVPEFSPTPGPTMNTVQPPVIYYVIVEPGGAPRSTTVPTPQPTPAPTACPHPGNHLGLKPCRWPHA